MSVLSEIITVNITRETAGLTQAGFGTGMIFGDADKFASVDGVITTLDATLVASNSIAWTFNGVAQTPIVFAVDEATTMDAWATAIQALADVATAVAADVGAVGFKNTITVVGAADPARCLFTGMIITLGASQPTVTQVYTPHTRIETYTGTDDMLVAGGGVFAATDLEYLAAVSLMAQNPSPQQFKIGNERAGDASKTAALAAIAVQDDDWYGIVLTSRVQADQEEVALWTETQRKIFITSTAAAITLTTTLTGIAGVLSAANYDRSAVIYHVDSDGTTNDQWPDAAWFGKILPKTAGAVNWAWKTLATITVSSLNATERLNALNKSCNIYYTVAGVGVTREGTMASGEFIDTMRGADHLQALIEEGIFGQYVNQDKIPYDDSGIETHVAEIEKAINTKLGHGYLTPNTDINEWDGKPYLIEAPLSKDVSANNKANRTLTDITFATLIAGAINSVVINGTVTV